MHSRSIAACINRGWSRKMKGEVAKVVHRRCAAKIWLIDRSLGHVNCSCSCQCSTICWLFSVYSVWVIDLYVIIPFVCKNGYSSKSEGPQIKTLNTQGGWLATQSTSPPPSPTATDKETSLPVRQYAFTLNSCIYQLTMLCPVLAILTLAHYTSILMVSTVMYTHSAVSTVSEPTFCAIAANIV